MTIININTHSFYFIVTITSSFSVLFYSIKSSLLSFVYVLPFSMTKKSGDNKREKYELLKMANRHVRARMINVTQAHTGKTRERAWGADEKQ